ncbi:MAG: sulfatase-like hydrolase/transferase [Bacteroidales bacterium]|nr:sulfatase-like hydrolase/transferase [Bacteroidales bacterium]
MNKKAIALPLLALGGVAMAQNDPQHPNVVFVLADDMGFSGIHCYGGDGIQSPNIDYLAENGIVCTNFRATPLSSPTRVSIMTGCYQQRAGLNHIFSEVDPMDGLDPETHPTFAKLLQEAGYRTGLMGKWHMGQDIKYNPLNHGWDVWHGYTMGNIDFHSHYNTQHKSDWWGGKELKDEPGYVTYLINKYSVQFIRESVEMNKPFFLFVSENAVHVPMQGPNDPVLRDENVCPYRNDQDMTDKEYRRVYQDMVQAVDDGVGQIYRTLEELGVLENTLIIYTSDNGGEQVAADKYPGNNGYFRGAKGGPYEGGCRVPAIFYYPKEWGHRMTMEPMISADYMPTFLEFCGVKNPRKVDGVSLMNTLRTAQPLPQRKLYSAITGFQSVVDGDWKLIQKENSVELYNLFTDRNEEHDLSEMYPDKVKSMVKDVESWWEDCTKGTRLEGKTTYNSGWMIDYRAQLQQMQERIAKDTETAKKNKK